MKLSELKAALRAGKSPHDLKAKVIGRGAFRTAFQIGPFVVKLAQGNHGSGRRAWMREAFKGSGLRIAPEVSVRAEDAHGPLPWVIQLFYNPLWSDIDSQKRLLGSPEALEASTQFDGHFGNIGTDSRGRFVAFDY